MADFATPKWIDALAHRAATVDAPPGVALTIEQYIDGECAWHCVIREGRIRVVPGPATDPTATLSTSHAAATAIERGELSAQRAFLDGNLRIGGDIGTLIEHRAALAALAEVMAPTT